MDTDKPAYYNITAYALPVLGENYSKNNVAVEITIVRTIKHILFDQVHGTDYIGDFNQWMASLEGRGYVVDALNTYPVTSEVLEKYDVFIIPEASSWYTPDELSAVQSFVLNGGGLLVIGGYNPSIFTDLTGFAGITWSWGGVGGITTDITPHPVTAGVESVYIASPSVTLYVNGTAQGLIRDLQNNTILAVSEQPSGKVAGYADVYGLFDYYINQADNMLLADNMIDWLSMPNRAEHDVALSLIVPSSMQLNESTSVNFTVTNRGLNNESNVELYLLINNTMVSSTTVPELDVGQTTTSFSTGRRPNQECTTLRPTRRLWQEKQTLRTTLSQNGSPYSTYDLTSYMKQLVGARP